MRSLRNKVDVVHIELINTKLFDVLTFSGTWLDDSVSDNEINLGGYSCIRQDRSGNCPGGAVLIYLRSELPTHVREDMKDGENECIWVEINRKKCKHTLICCAYKSPHTDITKFTDGLTASISLINQDDYEVIMLGDFNVDFLLRN